MRGFEILRQQFDDTDEEFIRHVICSSQITQDRPLFKCSNIVVFENCLVLMDVGYCTICGYCCAHVLYGLKNDINEDESKTEEVLTRIVLLNNCTKN